MRTHVVQKGDTLWKIAKQYGISFDELKSLNGHLANPDYVVPGMEVILPDQVSNNVGNTGNKASIRTTSYKEKLTEPIGPITEQTQPSREVAPSKEQMTMPMPELPPQPVTEVKPSKEKMTQPLPEYVMPTPPPQPAPMPQVQPEIMPEFHFAPQFTFTQPQPMPMPQSEKIIMTQPMPQPQPQPIPMPMPQPIMIEVPKPEVRVEEKEVIKTEYVPVPQPYYIYVPYCPCPEPMPMKKPCSCKKQHHVNPCGCGGGMQNPMHMPVHMPIQHMDAPCGCNDSAPYNHMMMPYDSNFMHPEYFDPNYDMSPLMDMDDHGKDSNLPDWLVDSSSVPSAMGSYEQAKGHMNDDDFSDDKGVKGSDFYHQMRKHEDDYNTTHFAHDQYEMNYPHTHYMPYHVMPDHYNMQPYMSEHYNVQPNMPEYYGMPDYNMQHSMPYHMMPQQQTMPHHMNYQSNPYYPNYSQQSSGFRPWSY